MRSELGIAEDQPVVLYAGTFADYQGLANLTAAMPKILETVPRAVLVLVGTERTNGSRGGLRLEERVPLESRRLLGRQPQSAISRYLAMADVVVSPRIYGSNLPLKVLEYLAAGCAIVATAIPAHSSVLNDERALLVQPTPEGLAAGITELLEAPERARRLQAGARSFAERNLDWLGFVHSVGEVLDEVRRHGRLA